MRILFFIAPYVIDPLGVGYLSSILKKLGHEIHLEHCNEHPEFWQLEGLVQRIKPDMVCFSVTTGQHQMYTKVAHRVKSVSKQIITVFGGPHPTYFTQVDDSIDYLVRGEADLSFPKLIKDIESGVTTGRLIQPSLLVQDLDSLPLPDRELIYKFPENLWNPIKNVLTSRGCPFSCPYCYNGVYKALYKGQKVVRLHSIDRVIAECEEVKNKWNAKYIFFIDDEFTINDDRLSNFADRYTKEIGLPYHAQLRVDLLTEKKARILKDSGCSSVTFAIESGGEEYRKKMLQRNMTNKQILDGAKILHKVGLRFRTENMIGLPYETFDDAMTTLKLNIKCKPELAWASLYQPYPGTPLGDLCIRDGLFSGTVDDLKPSFFEDSVLPLKPKRMFVNLQRLFGLVASFPFLRFVLPVALRLPTNKIYAKIYSLWKKHKYDDKLYKY